MTALSSYYLQVPPKAITVDSLLWVGLATLLSGFQLGKYLWWSSIFFAVFLHCFVPQFCLTVAGFAKQVGEARKKFKVYPPRVDGDEGFLRVFRAQWVYWPCLFPIKKSKCWHLFLDKIAWNSIPCFWWLHGWLPFFSIKVPIDSSINQSINRSIGQCVKLWLDYLINQPTNQSRERHITYTFCKQCDLFPVPAAILALFYIFQRQAYFESYSKHADGRSVFVARNYWFQFFSSFTCRGDFNHA